MSPIVRGVLRLLVLVAVMVFLFLLFPAASRFAAGAATSVVRLWWLILLLALGVWLIWGVRKRPK